MEPIEAEINGITYTVYSTISEVAITGDWFAIDGFGAHLYTKHNLSIGDRVKITIQKEPECPPSQITQPDPSSNS